MSRVLRNTPRFSLNKLAEYMVASPRRRRSLILDQIQPVTAKVITYEDARRVLVRFFSNPERSGHMLWDLAGELRDLAAATPDGHRRRCLIASAQAVEAFAPLASELHRPSLLAVPGFRKNASIELSGVRVVVTPDICFLERGTERRLGALKLHCPRTTTLNADALQYAACVLFEYLHQCGDAPLRQHCLAVDVFSETCQSAPRASKDRLKNLEAACEEIAERWASLYDSLVAKGVVSESHD